MGGGEKERRGKVSGGGGGGEKKEEKKAAIQPDLDVAQISAALPKSGLTGHIGNRGREREREGKKERERAGKRETPQVEQQAIPRPDNRQAVTKSIKTLLHACCPVVSPDLCKRWAARYS